MMVTAIALLVSFASTRFLRTPVDLTIRAARVSVVLRKITEAAGVSLKAGPNESEILVVRSQALPLDDLMQRIAFVCSGTWVSQGPGFLLVPDVALRRAEARREAAARAAYFRGCVRHMLDNPAAAERWPAEESLATLPPSHRVEAEVEYTDSLSDLLAARLLMLVDPNALAAKLPSERLVFATDPTATQLPLGPDGKATVAEFVERINRSVDLALGDSAGFVAFANLSGEGSARAIRAQESDCRLGEISKAILAITGDEPLTFSLRLYDNDGLVECDLGSGTIDQTNSAPLLNDPAAASAKSASRPAIPYSEDGLRLMRAVGRTNYLDMGFLDELSPELIEKLYRPDLYDPLSFQCTDELLALAANSNCSLVANLPDDALPGLQAPASPRTIKEVEAWARDGGAVVPSFAGGTLLIKPRCPDRSRRSRFDRVALSKFLQETRNARVPTLDQISQFARAVPPPPPIVSMYLDWLVPGMPAITPPAGWSWDDLRFYASLDPRTRGLLESGRAVAVHDLTPAARGCLATVVYRDFLTVLPDLDERRGGPDGQAERADLRSEPTEMAPTGVPDDAQITLESCTEPFAFPAGGVTGATPAPMESLRRWTSRNSHAADQVRVPRRAVLVPGTRRATSSSEQRLICACGAIWADPREP